MNGVIAYPCFGLRTEQSEDTDLLHDIGRDSHNNPTFVRQHAAAAEPRGLRQEQLGALTGSLRLRRRHFRNSNARSEAASLTLGQCCVIKPQAGIWSAPGNACARPGFLHAAAVSVASASVGSPAPAWTTWRC